MSLAYGFEEAKIAGRLLGEALRSAEVMRDLVAFGMRPGDLTAPGLAQLWGVMCEQLRVTGRIDIALLEDALAVLLPDEASAMSSLDFCLDSPPLRAREELPGLIEHMRMRVANRRLADTLRSMAEDAQQPYAQAPRIIASLRGRLEAIEAGASALKSAGPEELAAIGQSILHSGRPIFERVPFGLPMIDDALGGGAIIGRVNIVGAGTGVGKTTFAKRFLLSALFGGFPCLYFSFEAEREELVPSIIETMARSRFPEDGQQTSRTVDAALAEATARLAELPLWIDDSSALTVEEVVARLRMHKHAYGVRVAFIDYVQDITRSTSLGRDDLNFIHISQSLRRCAKDERVAIIGLSQVTDLKPGERLTAKSTAFSQQFAKDAACVVMIERDQAAKNESQRDVSHVSLVKNRITGKLVEEFMRYDRPTNVLVPCGQSGRDIDELHVEEIDTGSGYDEGDYDA